MRTSKRIQMVVALLAVVALSCKNGGDTPQEDGPTADLDLGLDAPVSKKDARPDTQPTPDTSPTPVCSGGSGGQTGASVQTMQFSSTERKFAVHVPPSYDGSKCVPLIIHFHGYRPAPSGIEDEVKYVWGDTADQNNFIAVAPEGLPCPDLNPGGAPYLCFFTKGSDDGGFTEALVANLGKLYNIDQKRTYLSGHSGGSFFVQGHAERHQSDYAGVVEFSGGCTNTAGYAYSCSLYDSLDKQASRKIPFFCSHNPKDQVVDPNQSALLFDLLTKNGHPVAKYPTQASDPYNGGTYGHSIDPIIPPIVWKFLEGFATP